MQNGESVRQIGHEKSAAWEHHDGVCAIAVARDLIVENDVGEQGWGLHF